MLQQDLRIVEQSNATAVAPSFLVGQDHAGHWLAIEEHGLGGGLFASKEAALRYVKAEVRSRPGCCHLAAEAVDLRFGPERRAAA